MIYMNYPKELLDMKVCLGRNQKERIRGEEPVTVVVKVVVAVSLFAVTEAIGLDGSPRNRL